MPLALRVLLVAVLALAGRAAAQPLPLVDLAQDGGRRVVVDREEGQYLGHVTTVLLEDGRSILAVYPKGHGKGAIVMKRSSDGGRTWSGRLATPENWATSLEVPTIHRVIDPRTGRTRLILFSGLHPCRMAVSEDDGTTWSSLQPVGDWGGIVTMGSVVRLTGGDYLAMFHDDGRFLRAGGKTTGSMELYQVVSRDGGLTWSQPRMVFGSRTVHLCEPGIVRSPDGRQLAALLRENRRTGPSYVIVSNDEGTTWSAPKALPISLAGDRHTAKYGPDGRLFITFRDMAPASPTRGDWVGWVGTYRDLVNGGEGQYRVRLMDNTDDWDCAYPGLEVLPDGTFVATTYGHWDAGKPPYIVSVRFTLKELDRVWWRASVPAARAGAVGHHLCGGGPPCPPPEQVLLATTCVVAGLRARRPSRCCWQPPVWWRASVPAARAGAVGNHLHVCPATTPSAPRPPGGESHESPAAGRRAGRAPAPTSAPVEAARA